MSKAKSTQEKANQASTVADLVCQLTGDNAFAEQTARRAGRRTLINQLVAYRVKLGMSQGDVGKKLNRSQSTVSKIEHAADEDIRFGDIVSYSKALGLSVTLTLADQEFDAVSKIKHHAFRIKELLEQIVALCHGDEDMEKKASEFVNIELPVNLLYLIVDAARKLPKRQGETAVSVEEFQSEFLLERMTALEPVTP